jgi:hypothetical protein
MNIINWLFLKKQQLIKTKVNDPATDLILLGGQVPFTTRDDGYQDYAMTVQDFAAEVISQIPVVEPLYKTLQLKVSQTGTSAPTVTVLNNDFPGLTFVSNYAATGSYYLEFNQSIFSASTTFWLVSPAVASHIGCDLSGGDIFEIFTRLFNGTLTNAILNNTLIEIRIYN